MDFTNRKIAIERTLKIEKATSIIVKHLIGIPIQKDTKSLNNKSSALSLRAKIDILYDSDIVNKKQYSNIIHIISIRNQFAHNFECDEFSKLTQFIDGIEKPLLSSCENMSDSMEENLKTGFIKMTEDIFGILKLEYNKVISDYKKSLKKENRQLSNEYNKMLDYYGIVEPTERKVFKTKFIAVLQDEKIKGVDDTLNKRVHNKILSLLTKRLDDKKEKLKELKKKS